MLIDVVFLGAVTVIPLLAAGGLRRWPWRYAGLGTLGYVVVLVAARLTVEGIDPGLLVWVGAFGGALATLGSERGERERVWAGDADSLLRSTCSARLELEPLCAEMRPLK